MKSAKEYQELMIAILKMKANNVDLDTEWDYYSGLMEAVRTLEKSDFLIEDWHSILHKNSFSFVQVFHKKALTDTELFDILLSEGNQNNKT